MKIILWIIAILIIPGFLIWGVGVGGGGKSQYYAATVNKEHITLREYYKELGEVEEQYRKIFGEKTSELLKGLNIEQGVLESMIREKILLQEARRRRIRRGPAGPESGGPCPRATTGARRRR
ncbi:MAG: SurA N-terminal domain-containing protein [Candidatus Omnitrophica bacterium]|nr:SurA N-terminal domain-containing protein [Candidatus Omnitrophota bacterium]